MANRDVAEASEQYGAAVGQLLERAPENMLGDVGDSEQAIALALMYSDDLQASFVGRSANPTSIPWRGSWPRCSSTRPQRST